MILFLLTNWKCLLKIGFAGFVTILLTYSCYLSHRVDDLKVDNKELSDQANGLVSYLKKYDEVKSENEAITEQLTTEMQNVKNDPKCPAPDSFKHVLSKLR